MKFPIFFASTSFLLLSTIMPASADADSCAKVHFSDLGWTDLSLTNATASLILDALGYESEQTLLGLNVTYEMLKNHQIDVFLGNWRPVQDEQFKAYFDRGDVEVITTNLTGAKFTLAVPTYVADAGVKSYDDLAKYADRFGSSIYGIEPGSNQPLLDMVDANGHGLKDWKVVESSEAAMLTQVERAVKDKNWIVFLAWAPHPMNLKYPLTYLSGGEAEYGPNFGGATVRTISRTNYAKECPNVVKLLSNLKFDIEYENYGMKAIMVDGQEASVAAKNMIAKRPELLKQWLDGVTTKEGGDGYEAVKSTLLSN